MNITTQQTAIFHIDGEYLDSKTPLIDVLERNKNRTIDTQRTCFRRLQESSTNLQTHPVPHTRHALCTPPPPPANAQEVMSREGKAPSPLASTDFIHVFFAM